MFIYFFVFWQQKKKKRNTFFKVCDDHRQINSIRLEKCKNDLIIVELIFYLQHELNTLFTVSVWSIEKINIEEKNKKEKEVNKKKKKKLFLYFTVSQIGISASQLPNFQFFFFFCCSADLFYLFLFAATNWVEPQKKKSTKIKLS